MVIHIPYRKQVRMAMLSADLAGKFRFVWKSTRQYTRWILTTYNRCEKIADRLRIKKPVPLVKMEEE